MSGWDESAQAWIASLGERGDWARELSAVTCPQRIGPI